MGILRLPVIPMAQPAPHPHMVVLLQRDAPMDCRALLLHTGAHLRQESRMVRVALLLATEVHPLQGVLTEFLRLPATMEIRHQLE